MQIQQCYLSTWWPTRSSSLEVLGPSPAAEALPTAFPSNKQLPTPTPGKGYLGASRELSWRGFWGDDLWVSSAKNTHIWSFTGMAGRVMLKLVWYHPGAIRVVILDRILVAGGRILAPPGTYKNHVKTGISSINHRTRWLCTSWKLLREKWMSSIFPGPTCCHCHLVNLSSFRLHEIYDLYIG